MNGELKDITQQLLEFRDKRNWSKYHTPKDLAVAIAIEAAELQQCFLWMDSAKAIDRLVIDKEFAQEVKMEVADVAIYLLYMVDALQMDLAEAIKQKIAKNAEKYKEGKDCPATVNTTNDDTLHDDLKYAKEKVDELKSENEALKKRLAAPQREETECLREENVDLKQRMQMLRHEVARYRRKENDNLIKKIEKT